MVGEKMSKSLGNIVTLRDAIERWGADTILLFFMTAHWRSPIDLSNEFLEVARTQVAGFREALVLPQRETPDEWERLAKVLDDDFNTPDALAVLHDWATRGARDLLARGLALFGLQTEFPLPHKIAGFLRDRNEARASKDWERADAIRAASAEEGWVITDHPGGSDAWLRP
jgi:cysteinyl-tRNA synthetase